MRQSGTPGLNVALARGGRIIWEAGFGFADVARKIPMTPATVMRSGSMGKTYTATAVMQLVERGVLGLHQPINTYLKGFKAVNPLGERDITVHDLLTHRSGWRGIMPARLRPPKLLQQSVREGYAQTRFGSYAAPSPLDRQGGREVPVPILGWPLWGIWWRSQSRGTDFSRLFEAHHRSAGMKSTRIRRCRTPHIA
jgi:CubicO group peptidase (beta-lactamase class C family)